MLPAKMIVAYPHAQQPEAIMLWPPMLACLTHQLRESRPRAVLAYTEFPRASCGGTARACLGSIPGSNVGVVAETNCRAAICSEIAPRAERRAVYMALHVHRMPGKERGSAKAGLLPMSTQ